MSAGFPMPSRIIQIEAPESFRDGHAIRREMAPWLFAVTGLVNEHPTPLLRKAIPVLSRELGVPVLDSEPDMLMAFWDGECERTKRHIQSAGAAKRIALVVRI